MIVEIKYAFEMREASPDVCEQFGKPTGTWEVIYSDGIRMLFAEDEQQAMDFLYGIASNADMGEFVIE